MGKIEQIQDAIARADRKESKLPEAVFQIGGYTSDRVRCLLNNLGAISSNYLEVGSHRGSTLVAALCNNDIKIYTAIDNFSELAEDGTVRNEFLANCHKFSIKNCLIEADCFSVIDIPSPVDFYLYDGNHSYESQKKALTHFIPFMSDEFILVVDDYNWEDVQKGTRAGIKEIGVEILFEVHLDKPESDPADGWWNGIYLALLKKK